MLKTLAFDKRGKAKDAYDLHYVVRHHQIGAEGIGQRIAEFGDEPAAKDAIRILQRDFSNADLVGPVRVAEFLGGTDARVQADAAGFVRLLLEAASGSEADGPS